MSDDDILDLVDIVQEGKVKEKTEELSLAGMEYDAPGHDYGNDLDALLMKATDHSVGSSADGGTELLENGVPLGHGEPADGHKVDPNEELELPPLSDLDALLVELGVDGDSSKKSGDGQKIEASYNDNKSLLDEEDIDADIMLDGEETSPDRKSVV